MSEQFKLNSDGECMSCNKQTLQSETIQCFTCKLFFHAVCPDADDNETLATKSFFTCYNRSSTKRNFQFFCNPCITKLENSMAESDGSRLNNLEMNMTTINGELSEIKSLLSNHLSRSSTVKKNSLEIQHNGKNDNIWFNKDRLASVKAPLSEPILVVNKVHEANSDSTFVSVEKTIVDNNIPVTKTFKNTSGELVLVCDTVDSRDKLNNLIASNDDEIQTKIINRKKPSITIVGLSTSYKKEEIVNQLVSQNQFVKHFAMANNIDDHIEIFDVKPTRSNPLVYQAFAAVSETLRAGLRSFRDKVVIGVMNCRIYDRYHIRRCNNCQCYGHYYKECPTPNDHCCAKCSLDHQTNVCTVTTSKKCINCSKAGIEESDHASYDHNCPSLLKITEKMKNRNDKNLNLRMHKGDHH